MIFDGMKFTHSKRHVILPASMWTGEHKGYVTFGRLAKSTSKNAIEISTNEWVVPIEVDSHGATNKMYGKDGRVYLAKDGQVYISGK